MILLDTHVLAWWQAGGSRLSTTAVELIAKSDVVLVSPVSCWELAMLHQKGRLALDRDPHGWVRDLFADSSVRAAQLSPQAAVVAGLLGSRGFHGDPADRMIYATAADHAVPLVSKDARIADFAGRNRGPKVVW